MTRLRERRITGNGDFPSREGCAIMGLEDKKYRSHLPIACPHCRSLDTETVSQFGSTPCKALHRCRACLEPFEYFKCI